MHTSRYALSNTFTAACLLIGGLFILGFSLQSTFFSFAELVVFTFAMGGVASLAVIKGLIEAPLRTPHALLACAAACCLLVGGSVANLDQLDGFGLRSHYRQIQARAETIPADLQTLMQQRDLVGLTAYLEQHPDALSPPVDRATELVLRSASYADHPVHEAARVFMLRDGYVSISEARIFVAMLEQVQPTYRPDQIPQAHLLSLLDLESPL